MIAHAHRLPHVRWKGNRMVPLSTGWLAESISSAAAKAGYTNWTHSHQVASAVTRHLELNAPPSVISVAELEQLVRQSLQGIGFRKVAKAAKLLPPRVSIYLPEIAEAASMPLLFFPLLRERFNEALSYKVRGIRLEGLRDCAKVLDSTRKWRRTTGELRDLIVDYARLYFAQRKMKWVELLIV